MLSRLFGKSKKDAAPQIEAAAPIAIPGNRGFVGLCFNYERGIGFENEYLTDTGTDHIFKTLAANRLRATFLCPAKLCETQSDKLAAIAGAGHEIAVLGYADESPKELTDDGVKQLVFACRNAFARCGLHPIGFRAPRSAWDERLCRELLLQQFRYSAEHDHAKYPYAVAPGEPPLYRLPIRTDDRGLRRSEDTYDMTVSKHFRVLRKAAVGKYFVSICFHPWILAEDMSRMEHWQLWIDTAVKSGLRIGALEDAIPTASTPAHNPALDFDDDDDE